MTVKAIIKRSEYHDSVSLMLVARELTRYPGVQDASVVMGTEANKGLLKNAGLLTAEAEAASANDLIIAIRAPSKITNAALQEADKLLQKKQIDSGSGVEYRPKTLRGAIKSNPGSNLAVISVAGRYAAAEAWDALRNGLHVLLFSDNVSLEDEIALKTYAVEHGLLLMGPGAGTAILNGVVLGFANVIPPGPVGIVSAAGTGLQEVSSLLARSGVGISQGIGTGGRDLKEEVGGLMMLAGLKALQADAATKIIVLVSKPPAESVARRMMEQSTLSKKPTVICFLGLQAAPATTLPVNAYITRTLEEASLQAAKLAGGDGCAEDIMPLPDISKLQARLHPGQRFLRGLFSGGTLCYEAQVIWRDRLAEPVWSNAPLDSAHQLSDSLRSQDHTAIDLGEEEFTVGRPHPMIDNDLRIRRLMQEASDPETAVIMLDAVLGYGAHPDPASELAPAVQRARQLAQEAGRDLLLVASVTGTSGDPQGLERQVYLLREAGVVVCESNAAAARLATRLVGA